MGSAIAQHGRGWRSLQCLMIAVGVAASGCSSDEPGNQTDPDAPRVAFVSPLVDRNLASGSPLTITYSILNEPTSALAFVDPDIDPNNGNERVFANDIPGGLDQRVNLNTADIPRGTYNYAIRASNLAGTVITYARDPDGNLVQIQVNDRPQPAVTSPFGDRQVAPGSTVDIVFNCNDPENEVGWTVFYDENLNFDGTETLLPNGIGTGNAPPGSSQQTVTWVTVGVPEGSYFVGVNCVDSASSEELAYATASITVSAQQDIPTVTVTEPSEDVTVFPDGSLTVEFFASDPDATGTITIIVDTDRTFGSDDTELVLAQGLPASTTSFVIEDTILAALPNGRYSVGAVFKQDGQSNVSYARGRITVVGAGDLTILSPDAPQSVRPGEVITIIWNTNVPLGQGLVGMQLLRVDSAGLPIGPVVPDPLQEAKDLPVSPNSYPLDTSELDAGFYVAQVTLNRVDDLGSPTAGSTSDALTPVIRVTTLPDIFWVGNIEVPETGDEPAGHFDGIIFEGVNFRDNAGSSVLALPELTPQARQESQLLATAVGEEAGPIASDGGFVIGARFAKPLFSNPNGIGMGEAYLIYEEHLPAKNRRYSLNGVGARHQQIDNDRERMAGMRVAGVAFDPRPEDILNLDPENPKIDLLTEDADGDSFLNAFNEDIDGDRALATSEDADLDGLLDLPEDGRVGIDADGDGVIDGNSPALSADLLDDPNGILGQFVNGALDVGVSEDRDLDGVLDGMGDATWGLSNLALLPDPCRNGYPVLAFGFEFTDSLPADYRTIVFDESEQPSFGLLTQENQFERGGIVMVPTDPRTFADAANGTYGQTCLEAPSITKNLHNDGDASDDRFIGDPTVLRPFNIRLTDDEDRVIQLDFVGQRFSDAAADAGDQNNTGLVGFEDDLSRDPANGYDVPSVALDAMQGVQSPLCGDAEVEVLFMNSLRQDYVARATFRITAGDDVNDVMIDVGPGETRRGSICGGDCAAGGVAVQLINVDLLDFNAGGQAVALGDATILDGLAPNACAAGQFVAFAVGSDAEGEFSTASLICDTPAECLLIGAVPFQNNTLCVPGDDNCADTLIGPFFGFEYGDDLEAPTHPLAYRRTLANPGDTLVSDIPFQGFSLMEGSQAWELNNLGVGCADCGKVLADVTTIQAGGAPPLEKLGTGYYPGEARNPVGARLLGQAVGDRFGASISSSPADSRVFVGAPQRTGGDLEQAGVVHQFKMEVFWDSASNISGINESDVPKPHQYIINEVGSVSPDGLARQKRDAISDDVVEYVGSEAGDQLGQAVIGLDDFNVDGQPDIFMGAPGADGKLNDREDSGAVYVIYRVSVDIEDSISLKKIELPPNDPERLNGLLINGDHNAVDGGDRLGAVLAGNCDLNDDGAIDLVIGSPLHGVADPGEVIVVFGGSNLSSPASGYSIQEVVDLGRAVRIKGARAGDHAGFNVTCNGDFDGDGQDDLVIAAPNATPMYDADGDDILETPGLDLDRDGNDDGSIAAPEGTGLVYVLTNVGDLAGTVSLEQVGGVVRGFTFVGLKGGDQLGGGIEPKRLTASRGLGFAGDIDDDGRDDLLVGSMLADPPGKVNAGEVYLIFGFDEREAESIIND